MTFRSYKPLPQTHPKCKVLPTGHESVILYSQNSLLASAHAFNRGSWSDFDPASISVTIVNNTKPGRISSDLNHQKRRIQSRTVLSKIIPPGLT